MPEEYIIREAVRRITHEIYECRYEPDKIHIYCDQLRCLHTADVAPVVHARWVVDEDGDVVCSNCGIDASCDCDGVLYTALFCGNCGARMDAKEDSPHDKA